MQRGIGPISAQRTKGFGEPRGVRGFADSCRWGSLTGLGMALCLSAAHDEIMREMLAIAEELTRRPSRNADSP
jgi:hypothetical protein